jgi:hypothetical protein
MMPASAEIINELLNCIPKSLCKWNCNVFRFNNVKWATPRPSSGLQPGPLRWPTDRDQRARIIGDWLKAEAQYLA